VAGGPVKEENQIDMTGFVLCNPMLTAPFIILLSARCL